MTDRLIKALEHAINVAHEISERYTEGLNVGGLMSALSGFKPGFRADIDKIHDVLSEAKGETHILEATGSDPIKKAYCGLRGVDAMYAVEDVVCLFETQSKTIFRAVAYIDGKHATCQRCKLRWSADWADDKYDRYDVDTGD